MRKKDYLPFFKNKKITVMGLGVLGRGLQVTQFLAECGAKLIVTDLKSKEALKSSVDKLKKYKIHYVLGKQRLEDFESRDLVIKAAGVPLNSEYIKHARSKNIPIAMDASLFAKLVQDAESKITLIGVTGTRGKSMTTALIYHILKKNEEVLGGKVYLGGNMRGKATLPLIKKVCPGDFVVLELDSWQCQGFGDDKISPHIAVFTNLMNDHLNYYKNEPERYLEDKANIYKFQEPGDVLVTNKELLKILKDKPNGKVVVPDLRMVSDLEMKIFGRHNLENTAYAFEVARAVGIEDSEIRYALQSFPGLEGRLQYLGEKQGVHIINDNNSTTPEATLAGLEALRIRNKTSGIILICGGADKNLNLTRLAREIKKSVKKLILIPGTGTEKLKKELAQKFIETKTLEEAMEMAFGESGDGDVILFSPGFASFGLFNNEYERNDEFIRIIKRL